MSKALTDQQLPQEQLTREDEMLIAQMKQGMAVMDRAYSDMLEPPNLLHIQQMVAEHKTATRRKLRNELFVFVMVAIALTTGGFLVAYSNLTLFGILQLVVAIFAVILLLVSQHRVKGRGRTNGSN
jgi:Family of unknown function (DUF5345)